MYTEKQEELDDILNSFSTADRIAIVIKLCEHIEVEVIENKNICIRESSAGTKCEENEAYRKLWDECWGDLRRQVLTDIMNNSEKIQAMS